jgi:hypothetical protein
LNQTIFHIFTESEQQPDSGAQLLKILKFFKEKLKLENEFLLNEILFSDDRKGRRVFSNLLSSIQKDFFSNFFDFLQNDLVLSDESLKNHSISSEFLMFSIAQNEEESRDRIVKFFEEKFQTSFFSINFYSAEILHKICENYSRDDTEKILNYFDFVEEKNEFEFLKNYISGKNSKGQTILVHFYHYDFRLIKVLEWLEKKFRNDKNFLMQVDENGDSFLHVLLRKCDYWRFVDRFFTETFEFLIRNFDKSFVQNFLLIQNKRQENCLNLFCQRVINDKEISETLDLLSKDFQNDREFFTKLLNEELKKNEKVKKWIRKNLDFIDLSEVGSRCSESRVFHEISKTYK